MTIMNNHPKPGQNQQAPAASQGPPRIASADILRGASTAEIEHAGQRYLLRVTRENKLILTK